MTCYWWLTSSLIIHCSPADVWVPSKNLANWQSIVSVTNSADIKVYSCGLWDGSVDNLCWLCTWKFQSCQDLSCVPSMTTLLSRSLLVVLDDYASLAPYSNIILYHSWLTHPNGSYFCLDILHPYAMLICTCLNPHQQYLSYARSLNFPVMFSLTDR